MTDEEFQVLTSLAGSVIARIYRIYYVFQDVTNTRVGSIDLEFGDGSRIVFDADADGEALAIKTGPWVDPFAQDGLSDENREFIAKSGKWTMIDVSDEINYAHFIGTTINAVESIRTPSEKIVGAVFHTTNGSLRMEVEADDLYVETI